ncbi:MAG TPA: efflux RND transporter periplasmic adaptor subunit [Pyrinomonadaceae bacterium]|nr:efflux RND transporter periplasmic adaptor subunit [Pyrinomonadaceae bacterium]
MKSKANIHLELGKLAAALVLTVAATGCGQPTKVAAKSPTPVHLADVAVYSSSEGLRYSASVLPFAEATLSFKSSGYVTGVKQVASAYGRRRNVGAGDYVPRGAVLAQIRHQDLKNQLDQTEAAVRQAQAQHIEANQNYDRAKALYATRSLTKPEFDQAQARFDSTLGAVDQAKANLHQAQLTLADADLTAPFSGYILARNIELGNLVAPGTVAFTIADTSAVKIGFGVPEYAVRQLRLGQEFTIHLQDDPKEYKGRVTSIAAGADEKNRVFAIEVTVPNPKSYLKPGMIASLNLSGVQNVPVPSVPLSAVVANPAASGRYAVFVATEQAGKWTAHLRDVTLGETHESDVAIEGLKPGEKVVVSGTADLKDGDLIQVLP